MHESPLDQLIDRALAHHQQGQLVEARQAYQQAMSLDDNHPDVLNLYGMLLLQEGQTAEAVTLLGRAVVLDPEAADLHINYAEALRAAGQFDDAIAEYRKALPIDPSLLAVWQNLGTVLQIARRFDEAADAWNRAIALDPNSPQSYNNLGLAAQHGGKLTEAAASFEQALKLDPSFPAAIENLTILQVALGWFSEANATAQLLTTHNPSHAPSYVFLAATFLDTNQPHDAIDACRDALRLDPKCVTAHFNMGRAMTALGELKAAAIAYSRAASLQPDGAIAHLNLGITNLATGEIAKAVRIFEYATEIAPELPEAWLNLAVSFERLGELERAIEMARKALELRPTMLSALSTLGILLLRTGRHEEGDAVLRKAIALNPLHTPALAALSNLCSDRGDHVAGRDLALRAVASDPKDPRPYDVLLMAMLSGDGHSPAEIFAAHRSFGLQFRSTDPVQPHRNVPQKGRRLRIGYVSPDFRAHSVSFFIAEIIRHHDRSAFEIFCYDDSSRPDAITQRIHDLSDHWRRVVGVPSERLCDRIRQDKINILIDLAGHTADNRLLVFAAKPAPIQMSYLGYPGTTGLSAIDYRLTDALADPVGEADAQHTETLIRMTPPFIAYTPTDNAPPVAPVPAKTIGYVTFGSFNATAKMNDGVIALWARVLNAIADSRLILKSEGLNDPETCRGILRRFADQGIDNSRIRLIKRTPTFDEHMRLYAEIDIALDPFPYNGTTTTCEALWMGVPVLTLAGRTHAARVGVSLLSSAQLVEWIAASPDEYVDIARRFAIDLPALQELRDGMRDRLQASPLLDSRRITNEIEHAYKSAWDRYCDSVVASAPLGDEPAHIVVEGWRFVPHSYALINQFQCLELLKRPGIRLSFVDLPALGRSWRATSGLLPAAAEQAIAAIPAPWPEEDTDVVFRMGFPADFSPARNAPHTVVFDTSEVLAVPSNGIKGVKSLSEITADSTVTIVTPSQWSRQGFLNAGVHPTRIKVVPHGVDTDLFRPLGNEERTASRTHFKVTGFCFLNVGAMTNNKGLQTLLLGFARVLKTQPECQLLLKGLDTLYNSHERLKQKLAQLDVDNSAAVLERIRYVGESLSFDQMRDLYSAADAYVTPYHAEGFNVPVLEAVACGLPVICTGGGPTDDFTAPQFARYIRSTVEPTVVNNEPAHVLLPDVDHLVELMTRMVDDIEFRNVARAAGPRHVRENYTWRHVVDRLLPILLNSTTPIAAPL